MSDENETVSRTTTTFHTIWNLTRGNDAENIRNMVRRDVEILTKRTRFGDTLFTFACRNSEIETVQLFIKEFGSDIHETASNGRNCFMCAAAGGKVDTMRYLHSLDNTLFRARDDDNATALTFASCYGSKGSVEYLITELKVDVQETGVNGRNCFMHAAVGGKVDTMRYLHSLDDTLCQARDDHNDTALTLASELGFITWNL